MTEKQVKPRLTFIRALWLLLTGPATFHPGDLDHSGQLYHAERVAADGFWSRY